MHLVRLGICIGLATLLGALTTWTTRPVAVAAADALDVLVVGDSLAVGTQPFLDELLAGRNVIWDARGGRTTPQGMKALRSALRRVTPQAVVVSLGTNDGPDAHRFTSRLRRILEAVPLDACVVWTNVKRPLRKGAYRALNRALEQEARADPRLVVLDWEGAVVDGAVRLPDGLHADADGYRYRSRMIAEAVRSGCESG